MAFERGLVALCMLPLLAGCASGTKVGAFWALEDAKKYVRTPYDVIGFRDSHNLRYIPDSVNYGGNHWATPHEVMKNGGGDSADLSGLAWHLLAGKGWNANLIYMRRKVMKGEDLSMQEHDGDYVYRVICAFEHLGRIGYIGATKREDGKGYYPNVNEVVKDFSKMGGEWEFVDFIR